jgi:ferritin
LITTKMEGAMLSEKMEAAYNRQITAELYASNLYLAMGAYFDALAYRGFGQWLRAQSEEERQHAVRIVDIVVDRGGTVDISGIESPGIFESPLAVFEQVVAQEQSVTRMFHDLSELAEEESDHTTMAELEWFLLEQVEEERTTRDILREVRRVHDSPSGMLVLDRHLADLVAADAQADAGAIA